jgi:hypothetical protein
VRAAALLLALAFGGALQASAQTPPERYFGSWRIARGVASPWLPGAPLRPETALVGERMQFGPARVDGPGVLGCTGARYTATQLPAEGLFQGTLPAPAALAAEWLGFASRPVEGFSLACSTGLFEFHSVGPDALLFALDNVIWTLDRSAGALAAEGSPEAFVQALLEAHFASPMGFEPDAVALKRTRLSGALARRIDAYFARPRPADEVPPIDGDPFTDAQEYPTRFAVRTAQQTPRGQEVPVDFADAHGSRRVDFLLVHESGGWRLDDLRYSHGSFSALLAN